MTEYENRVLEALMTIAINLKRQADGITEMREELRQIRLYQQRQLEAEQLELEHSEISSAE